MWMRMPGRSTFKLLILLSGSIFVSETFILQVLPRLVNSVGWASAIVDASLLTLVTFPLLYFFSFRPMKQFQSGLQESIEQYRMLFDQMISGLLVCEVICDDSGKPYDHRFLGANPAFEKMTGIVVKDQVGKTNKELVNGWPPEVTQRLYNVAMTGEPIEYERYNETTGQFYETRVFSPKHGQFAHVFTDITKRKQAEEALRESEERYRSIIHASPDDITITDLEGRIIMVSPIAFSMFGLEREEQVRGLSIFDFIVPEDRSRALSNMTLKLQGLSNRSNEYRALHKDGSTFDIEVNSDFIRDIDGRPTKIVIIIRDITSRKQAEAALRETDKKFRTLYENSRDALMTLTPPSWSYTSCNKATAEMFRAKSVEELISYGPATVSPERQPDGRLSVEKADEILKIAMREGSYYFEWTHKRFDGEEFPATVLLTRMELEGKQFLQATVRDISEQKRAEAAMLKSKHQYENLAANVPVGIYILRTSRNGSMSFDYLSPKIAEMFSVDIGSLLADAKGIFQMIHPDDLGATAKLNQEMIQEPRSFDWEGRIVIKGTVKWIRIESTFELMGKGDALWHGVIADITERKRAEHLLRQSEEKFRTAFLTSPDSININRMKDGMYVSINEGFTRITGYTEEDVIGKTSLELNIWDIPEDRQRLVAGLKEHGKVENLETRFRKKNGTTLFGLMSASLIQVEGEPHLLSITRDITELRQAEEKKMDLERQLLHAQKLESIGTLAGGIAHDFNNVLGGIMGYTEMSLQYAEKNSKLERNLVKILKATDRAKHLIEQILTFSRKTNPQKSITSIRPIIKEVLDLLRASIPSSIIIESDLEKNTKSVLADPTKIHEAILNLATNAVHAMNGKGTLTIKCRVESLDRKLSGQTGEIAPGEYIVIEVADTGCGMDATTLSKAFEPFFTTKAVGEGTGMGLSVVLGVVQSLGGDIQVESTVGKGTIFLLYLPVVEDQVPGHDVDDDLLQLRGTERILFVDDEQMLVELAKDMLTPLGYSVVGVSESSDALKLIEDERNGFDILITDQTMPRMTGIELAKEVLKIRNGLPVILCTGFSNELNPDRAVAIGINEILMKPFRVNEIGAAIRKIFDNRNKG